LIQFSDSRGTRKTAHTFARAALTRTPYTAQRSRIGLKPLQADEFPTRRAIAEIFLPNPLQSRLELAHALAPARLGRVRHGLHLQGVHSGKPTDTLLIELDRRPVGAGPVAEAGQLFQLAPDERFNRGGKAWSDGIFHRGIMHPEKDESTEFTQIVN
jgi:hypothetical protein